MFVFLNMFGWYLTNKYRKFSMTRIQMARLLWLMRIAFETPGIFSIRKHIFSDILGKFSYFTLKTYVIRMYSLESLHQGNSNGCTQHTIILWKIVKTSLNYFQLPLDLVLYLTPSGSNYPCLEQISTKMFKPLYYAILFGFITKLKMFSDRHLD